MATEVGGNLINDSVVFGYDTGYGVFNKAEPLRFYKGEPATNVQDSDISAMTQTGFNNWGAYDGNNTPHHSYSSTTQTKTLVNIPGPDGKLTNAMLYHNVSGGSFGPTNWSGVPSTNLANGSKITLQAWVKATDASFVGKSVRPHLYYTKVGGGSYSASTNHTLTMDWQLVKHCYTVPEGATGNGTFYLFTGAGETKMYVTQTAIVPDKLHSVVWLQGGTTRSDTASLIDLRRTKDIDVSNTSFDSSGQMNFDASDDQIVVDVDSIVRNADTITIEGIVNASVNAGAPWGILTDHTVAGDKDGFWWHYNIGGYTYFRVEDATAGEQGTTFPGSVPFVSDVNQHVVTVVGLNHVSVYVNGELEQSYTPNFRWNRIDSSKTAYLHIGRTFPNYYLAGEVPVFKMHNRKLTASEIKQSYQSYKKRFNL